MVVECWLILLRGYDGYVCSVDGPHEPIVPKFFVVGPAHSGLLVTSDGESYMDAAYAGEKV